MIAPLVLLGEMTRCQLTGGVRLLVLNKSRFERDADHHRSTLLPLNWRATRAGVKIVSTNHVEPPNPPPLVNPRARTLAATGMLKPLTSQPPEMCEPAPALIQSSPSAEKSSVVRATSGLVPPRNQVIVEPSWARLSVGAPVLFSRPITVRRCPPRVPKCPPATIF